MLSSDHGWHFETYLLTSLHHQIYHLSEPFYNMAANVWLFINNNNFGVVLSDYFKKKTTHLRDNDSNSLLRCTKELKISRNGKSAKFFSYANRGKYFEELFSLTINRIVVSGCMCLLLWSFITLGCPISWDVCKK